MSSDDPTYEEVKATLRRAMYARDPIDRADATAQLAWWGLPATPDALSLAAGRAYTDDGSRAHLTAQTA